MTMTELAELQREVTTLRAEGRYKETIESSFTLLQRGLEANDHKSMLVAYLNSAASYYCIGDIEEAFRSIDAYSGAKKPPVPENHGHPFRLIAATRSGNSRPPIPENHGHFVSPLA